MRRWLCFIAGVGLLFAAGRALAESLGETIVDLAEDVFEPSTPFDDAEHPVAPDYAEPKAWSAYPGRDDGAHSVPVGSPAVDDAEAAADVFFVAPTTFLSPSEWNGPAHDRGYLMREIDDGILESMASAFNACCRVYAPRYRQATIYAMFTPSDDSHKTIELAYSDVRRAFHYYLDHENHGRPFILAGHSQGSWHLLRLLADEIDGSDLRKRLIAVYAPGYLTPRDVFERELKHIRPCATPEATGCVILWNTFGLDGDPRFHRARVEHVYADGYEAVGDRPTVCVNPITWKMDGVESNRDDYLGFASFGVVGELSNSLTPGSITARCEDGVLKIDRYGVAHVMKAWTFPSNDSHPYDFSLFYLHIRANAVARTTAWEAAHPQ